MAGVYLSSIRVSNIFQLGVARITNPSVTYRRRDAAYLLRVIRSASAMRKFPISCICPTLLNAEGAKHRRISPNIHLLRPSLYI